MDYTDFGKTGLKVSVAGLGCGGHSRLGQQYGASVDESVKIVHAAMDLGVNLLDTASAYHTEPIVGKATQSRRDEVLISTKALVKQPKRNNEKPARSTPGQLRDNLESSLKNLRTDYIDIFHLHAVGPKDYQYCHDVLVPALIRMREEGKIRFIGITEKFITDTNHEMLARAVQDDVWDVMMVGFSLLNPSARTKVLVETAKKQIATLNMFAVRSALSNPAKLIELMNSMVKDGLLDPAMFDPADPLGFLTGPDSAASIAEAAYRFCRHEPGIDVVLTGTGNLDHLRENLSSICQKPLRDAHLKRLGDMFGAITSISGN